MARQDDLQYIIKDLIEGDEKVTERKEYTESDLKELRDAYHLLIQKANEKGWSERKIKSLMTHSWKLNYWKKPPSIDEFLSTKWLGETAESLFPYVRGILRDFWDTESPYRRLFLSTPIGWGKSFLTVISNLFVIVRIYCMRNPKHFFGLSPATVIAAVLISFTQDQAKKLLLQPFLNILESADAFKRVRTEEQLIRNGREDDSRIYWTSGGTTPLQFYNSLNIVLASDPANLLGLSILIGSITELAFFREAGISEDTINQIYNNLEGRIYSRFHDQWLSAMIIDSSPNSMDTAMDKYIFSGEAAKDPKNYVVTGPKWEWQPDLFPTWYKDNSKTFPVFRGTNSRPPRILQPDEINEFNPQEIFDVPIDIRHLFERDLVRNLKDYAGYPAGQDDKLISDIRVLDAMFSRQLQNVYGYLFAPADQPPEKLIWNQVKNRFFIHIGHGRYELMRNPRELRFISIDQSVANDFTGITMTHPEMNSEGEFVYIHDFTLNIIPGSKRINLQAIEDFVRDLRDKGGVKIAGVSFDQFQSENSKQQLKRDGFTVESVSVDRTMAPYLDYISLMNTGRIKAGKNIFLKNNLLSLQIVTTGSGKKKVDHVQLGSGKVVEDDGGKWETSKMGHGAKDLSDSAVASVALCKMLFKRNYANYVWEDDEPLAEIDDVDMSKKQVMDSALANIRNKFGLAAS